MCETSISRAILPGLAPRAIGSAATMGDGQSEAKRRVRQLLSLGFSQKTLASKMHMDPSQFSRWLNDKTVRGIYWESKVGLDQFIDELRTLLDHGPPADKKSRGSPHLERRTVRRKRAG